MYIFRIKNCCNTSFVLVACDDSSAVCMLPVVNILYALGANGHLFHHLQLVSATCVCYLLDVIAMYCWRFVCCLLYV